MSLWTSEYETSQKESNYSKRLMLFDSCMCKNIMTQRFSNNCRDDIERTYTDTQSCHRDWFTVSAKQQKRRDKTQIIRQMLMTELGRIAEVIYLHKAPSVFYWLRTIWLSRQTSAENIAACERKFQIFNQQQCRPIRIIHLQRNILQGTGRQTHSHTYKH